LAGTSTTEELDMGGNMKRAASVRSKARGRSDFKSRSGKNAGRHTAAARGRSTKAAERKRAIKAAKAAKYAAKSPRR
jgi:hypothetical protein